MGLHDVQHNASQVLVIPSRFIGTTRLLLEVVCSETSYTVIYLSCISVLGSEFVCSVADNCCIVPARGPLTAIVYK